MTCTVEQKAHCEMLAKEFAEHAADKAVKKTFGILGVNIDDPEKLEDFRQDLRFGGLLRRAADKGLMATITVIATAMAFAMGAGLLLKIKGGG